MINRKNGGDKQIALTFDDGPDKTWTPQILDILKKEGVNAVSYTHLDVYKRQRFFTIADFEALCAERGILIHEGLFFDEGRRVEEDPNLNADVALYRLGRKT